MTLLGVDRVQLAAVQGGKDCGKEALALAQARMAHAEFQLRKWAPDIAAAGPDKARRDARLGEEEKRLSGVAGTAYKTFATCEAEP